MGFLDKIKSIFSDTISDEEVASQEWVLCPNCNVNISKQDLSDNGGRCPNCKCNIGQGT